MEVAGNSKTTLSAKKSGTDFVKDNTEDAFATISGIGLTLLSETVVVHVMPVNGGHHC